MKMHIFRDRTTSKPCIRHNATVTTDLVGHDIGKLFACSDDEQMAQFFNAVARIYSEDGASLPMQLEYVSQNSALSDKGRGVMRLIGDYADHNAGE